MAVAGVCLIALGMGSTSAAQLGKPGPRGEAAGVGLTSVGWSTAPGWLDQHGLAEGCNGTINAVAVSSSNQVFVGGRFSVCGDTLARNIARFDPVEGRWYPLGHDGGNGVGSGNSLVQTLTFHNGELYVGGAFGVVNHGADIPAASVARWDGQQWHALSTPMTNGVLGSIHALLSYNGSLIVGGIFTMSYDGGRLATNVIRWDGSGWQPVGQLGPALNSGTTGPVYALAAFANRLYVGGDFSYASGATVINANGLASWNGGAWQAVGAFGGQGVGGTVRAMEVYRNELYISGSFLHVNVGAQIAANSLARWTGSNWLTVGRGSGQGVHGTIRDMVVSQDELYLAGDLSSVNVGEPLAVSHVARWDGADWGTLQTAAGDGTDRPVNALASTPRGIYLAGLFDRVGGATPANGVASWTDEAWGSLEGDPLGANGAVRIIARDGDLTCVGGEFSRIRGVLANGIACHRDGVWSGLGAGGGAGVNGDIYAIAIVDGEIYVGGSFGRANLGSQDGGVAVGNIARWDGQAWTAVGSGTGNGTDGTVDALTMHAGALVVGGGFDSVNIGAPVPAARVARWTGSDWEPLPGPALGGRIIALASFRDELYAGLISSGGVIRHDGEQWSIVKGRDDVRIQYPSKLAVWADNLYVGGTFWELSGGGEGMNGIARWDGQDWHSLGEGLYFSEGFPGGASALLADGDRLIVGGGFDLALGDPIVRARSLASWDGQSWSALGTGIPGGGISAVARLPDGNLLVGGGFELIHGQLAFALAEYGSRSIIAPPPTDEPAK
jgi:hypothetical protein